jgi:uncharacterized protein
MYNQIYQEKEFIKIAKPILRNSEFQRRKTFLHHQDSVYDHSLKVAFTSYKMAKKIENYNIKININNVVVGALLHDFYTKPWRENKNPIFWKKHGFTHGKIASFNAYQFFPNLMNERVENTIKRHMFPLTIMPPKYIEGWIITMADKYVSLEVLKKPKELPRYIGIDLSNIHVLDKCKKIYQLTENFVSNMY